MRARLLKTIGSLYDCASEPSLWPTCLSSIRQLLQSTSINLLHHDHRSKNGGVTTAVGADPELYRLYAEYGHAIDPWALRVTPDMVASGRIIPGVSLLSHAKLRNTEFYEAMGRRYETTRTVFGFLETASLRSAVLSLNRGDSGREFDVHDVRTLSVLLPHIRRALATQRRLGTLLHQRKVATQVMDDAAVGVILVDDYRQVLFANRYAARVLDARDGLVTDKGALCASGQGPTGRLRAALASAIAVTKGAALGTSASEMTLPRVGRPALQVAVTPVGRRGPDGVPSTAAAMVLVIDSETLTVPDAQRLQAVFALTPAEASVAAAMASGMDISEIAAELKVSRETVRSHVKRILGKAGVRTQSQFVRAAAVSAGTESQPGGGRALQTS